MSIVLFVLHDPEKLEEVLAAWDEAGVSGATVLFSTGLGRLRPNPALREDLPMIPSLTDFFPEPENLSRTIFSVIDDDRLIEPLVRATERVVGDLNEPDRGLLAVLPTSQIYGLRPKAR